jgi:hypothetical protein
MRRIAAVVAVGAALLLAGCTSSKPSAAPTRAAATAPGFTACGNFTLRAATTEGTWPLLSCAGLANVNPLPWARIGVGETLRILTDFNDAHPVLHAGSDVSVHGLTVTGLRAGNTLVTVGGWGCGELVGPAPALCPLLRLTVG